MNEGMQTAGEVSVQFTIPKPESGRKGWERKGSLSVNRKKA